MQRYDEKDQTRRSGESGKDITAHGLGCALFGAPSRTLYPQGGRG